MNTYEAKFMGRNNGAIGCFHRISAIVKGENEEAARLNLYDDYEHITELKLIKLDIIEAVRVHLNDGTSYITSVGPRATEQSLTKYFVGTWLNMGLVDQDDMKQCVKIDIIKA